MKSYPELDKVAEKIHKEVINKVNRKANKTVSEMPYKEQYILEKLIQHLKKSV